MSPEQNLNYQQLKQKNLLGLEIRQNYHHTENGTRNLAEMLQDDSLAYQEYLRLLWPDDSVRPEALNINPDHQPEIPDFSPEMESIESYWKNMYLDTRKAGDVISAGYIRVYMLEATFGMTIGEILEFIDANETDDSS